LVYRLIVASPMQPEDNKAFLKGAWLRHVTRFKFGGPIHIAGMSEAIELSNFVQRETISSLAKGMINHPENGRGFAHVTDKRKFHLPEWNSAIHSNQSQPAGLTGRPITGRPGVPFRSGFHPYPSLRLLSSYSQRRWPIDTARHTTQLASESGGVNWFRRQCCSLVSENDSHCRGGVVSLTTRSSGDRVAVSQGERMGGA